MIERIWALAQNVGQGITSSMVTQAFVLAFRIINKIIEENGNNAWLYNGTPHCFVRRDFVDTYDGILPCQVVSSSVTTVTTTSDGTTLHC